MRERDLRGMTEDRVARLAPKPAQKMPVCSTFGVRLAADLLCGISAGGRREAGGRLRQDRQRKIPICGMFSTGATGLEPATSGVTGVTKAFQRASSNRGIGDMKRFRQVR